VYAAAVTPRRLGAQDINLGVMWEVIDFLVERRVDGIVLLGSTGEFLHYSTSERMRMMGLAPRRSRVPVIINVSHSTLDGSVELAQAAAASGAAAVLVMPPYFFRYTPADIESFYAQFRREAGIDIPILFYDIPLFTNRVPGELAAVMLERGYVDGVKDSSGDWDSYRRFAAARSNRRFPYLMGNDSFFVRAWQENGIDGVVSGCAAAIPEVLVGLRSAMESNATEVITRLEARLDQFIAQIGRMPVPVGIREAAALRGLKLGPHAIPFDGDRERVAAEFREWFRGWLPEVQKEAKHA
jgi:dihydrodipicolinate synthase/N-acetylneuraminate lyase